MTSRERAIRCLRTDIAQKVAADIALDRVLSALYEPDAEMLVAGARAMEGWEHTHGTVIVGQPKDVLRAMLDVVRRT